jgi:glycolate oxidase
MEDFVKRALTNLVGQANFADDLIELVPYAYDASDHDHRPEAVVWPTHAEQISRILLLANEHHFTVTPRGAGTGLCGGAIPAHGGLILDMCLMDKIIDIRIPDRMVVAQPGLVYADLERALAPHGLFVPPDPASGSVCTIGGNVATNAGGIRGAKYGVTKDYVTGLEVILPDGQIMRTGSSCMRSISRYDLTGLFVGSEGTLGVITEITLKVDPKPTTRQTGLACFNDLKRAGKAITDVIYSGIVPSVLEIIDHNAIKVLRQYGGINLPDVMAMTLVETDGFTESETSLQMSRVIEILTKNGATGVRIAQSSEEADELWKVRKSIGSVAAQLGTNSVSEDVTVPISKVPHLLAGISAIVTRYRLPFVVFGHAGDGNLHPRIMFDRSEADQVNRVHQAVEEIFRLACDLGGTLTGEHGIGLAKAPYMRMEHGPVAMGVMQTLKKLFDPNNILNPGKMAL